MSRSKIWRVVIFSALLVYRTIRTILGTATSLPGVRVDLMRSSLKNAGHNREFLLTGVSKFQVSVGSLGLALVGGTKICTVSGMSTAK
jgi:hypothetical protein